jgi:shikimate 5-dehydrogenase
MRRLTAVLGWPIAHSKSPVLHDAAFAAVGLDAVMVPCAVPPDPPARLLAAVRGLAAVDALGASVTVPHKQTVVAACDQLSPLAAAVGAVNCLVFVDGAVHGHNTDVDGFVDGLRAAAVPLAGAAIVLGGGGAARAVAAGLGAAGLTIAVFARRPRGGDLDRRGAVDRAAGSPGRRRAGGRRHLGRPRRRRRRRPGRGDAVGPRSPRPQRWRPSSTIARRGS